MRSVKFHIGKFLVAGAILLIALALVFPPDLTDVHPNGTVLLDRNGGLLGATVAADGQWRMGHADEIPERFKTCLLEFEDRHFMEHHGVHIPSLVRAWQQNRRAGRTVSGGSTITMQLARMSGDAGGRTYSRKAWEIVKAIWIDMAHDKNKILSEYVARAPFGANVVGLQAAAWRWFGRDPRSLSWAENALLAVLPNAPALLHPGKGRDALKAKRDRLLERLHRNGKLDDMELSLALAEPLPEAPVVLARRAPHLLATLAAAHGGGTIHSTIDGHLQDRITLMADRYAPILKANEVHNAAVLVMDVKNGEVLAYVGNLPSAGKEHAPYVDVIQARRSTGSLLKPFLHAAMLQAGELMPDQLVADLPTHYEGFSPRNFDRGHAGAVPASQALSRSLNIPAVRALRAHGIDRTLLVLRQMGLRHIDRSASHYGLSLIMGGAESTLWELTGAYASMARILTARTGGASTNDIVHAPTVVIETESIPATDFRPPVNAAAAWHTLKALQQGNRPEEQHGWEYFGSEPIAWKTGTSFGHRDAWAIGLTGRYAVGVWTGNASGEGRPGLTGTLAAAPLMFDVFGLLPDGDGLDAPYDDLARMAVCRSSGHRAGRDCDPVDSLWTIQAAIRTTPCPYHRRILVDRQRQHRVAPSVDAQWVPWFILPPAMEYYYMKLHPEYRPLPPWEGDAPEMLACDVMEIIYPSPGAAIHIPIQLDGKHGRVVLEAAHRDHGASIFWDLDGRHMGVTVGEHRMPADLPAGQHRLTLTDREGRTLTTQFQVERSGLAAR